MKKYILVLIGIIIILACVIVYKFNQMEKNLKSTNQKISLVEQNIKNKEEEQKKIAKEIDRCSGDSAIKAIEQLDSAAKNMLESYPGGYYNGGRVLNYDEILSAAQFDEFDFSSYIKFNYACLAESGIYITGVYGVVE